MLSRRPPRRSSEHLKSISNLPLLNETRTSPKAIRILIGSGYREMSSFANFLQLMAKKRKQNLEVALADERMRRKDMAAGRSSVTNLPSQSSQRRFRQA